MTFDPAGQADNAGQFADKIGSDPEIRLAEPSGQRRTPEEIADDAIDKLRIELSAPADLQRIRGAFEDAIREAQTGLTFAISDNGRYGAARRALSIYDSGTLAYNDSGTGEHWTTVGILANALRDLIEPAFVPIADGDADFQKHELRAKAATIAEMIMKRGDYRPPETQPAYRGALMSAVTEALTG